MEKYLEKDYIIRAMSFYRVTEIENILKLLVIVSHNSVLQDSIIYYHQLLFVDNTEYYKILKKYDEDLKKKKSLNGIILLTGYFLHLKNMQRRNFDLWQVERQIYVIHSILKKKEVSFDDLQWGARLIRGNLIEIGPLQYELVYQTPKYLESYASKSLFKIHIPYNKELNLDDVSNSLEKVDSLIEKYYQEIDLEEVIYYTDSWLLSPELLQILDDDSHIIQFQKKFQLVGLVEDQASFLKFVIHKIIIF